MIPPLQQQHHRRHPALVSVLAAVLERVAPVLVLVDMAFCFFPFLVWFGCYSARVKTTAAACNKRGKSNLLTLAAVVAGRACP
jgi:hypothetical protein